MNRFLLAAAFVGIAAPALAIPSGPVNLVTNGGFEDLVDTGDGYVLNGWNSAGYGWATANDPVVPAYQGSLSAATGCVEYFCSISQTLATVAGRHYTLSFAFNPGPGVTAGGGETRAFWDDTRVADFVGGAQGWAMYRYNVVASGAQATLTFFGFQNPSASAIDMVSVTAAVPEPATWGLMLGGFALVGMATRARTRAVAA